jgi:hypothetical protein
MRKITLLIVSNRMYPRAVLEQPVDGLDIVARVT